MKEMKNNPTHSDREPSVRPPLTEEEMEEISRRLIIGCKLARKRVYEMKKQKGTEVAISRDGKIVCMSPDDWIKEFPID